MILFLTALAAICVLYDRRVLPGWWSRVADGGSITARAVLPHSAAALDGYGVHVPKPGAILRLAGPGGLPEFRTGCSIETMEVLGMPFAWPTEHEQVLDVETPAEFVLAEASPRYLAQTGLGEVRS